MLSNVQRINMTTEEENDKAMWDIDIGMLIYKLRDTAKLLELIQDNKGLEGWEKQQIELQARQIVCLLYERIIYYPD